MGTYAHYYVWVGAEMGKIDLAEVPASTIDILDSLYEGKPHVSDGLTLTHIYMHGQVVGVGVEVFDLDWDTNLTEKNVFDFTKLEEAQSLVQKVERVFSQLGLSAQIRIFHHIDLGG